LLVRALGSPRCSRRRDVRGEREHCSRCRQLADLHWRSGRGLPLLRRGREQVKAPPSSLISAMPSKIP
jgi:hypothetical protein